MCCFPPASSSTPLRPSVYYPSINLVVNIRFIRRFCDHLSIYIFSTILLSFWSQAGTLRRECHDSFEGPTSSLPSSALPRFLVPSFPPSSYLPRFILPPLPQFLRPASLPPSFSSTPPSIRHVRSPSRRFGSSCKASSSYVIFLWFKYKVPTRLVHSVCRPLPRKSSNEESPEKLFSLYSSIRRLKPSKYFIK